MRELGPELTRPVRKLSLGQRMKPEWLAVLLHQPAVLCLEEPSLGLVVNAQARLLLFYQGGLFHDSGLRQGSPGQLIRRLAVRRTHGPRQLGLGLLSHQPPSFWQGSMGWRCFGHRHRQP